MHEKLGYCVSSQLKASEACFRIFLDMPHYQGIAHRLPEKTAAATAGQNKNMLHSRLMILSEALMDNLHKGHCVPAPKKRGRQRLLGWIKRINIRQTAANRAHEPAQLSCALASMRSPMPLSIVSKAPSIYLARYLSHNPNTSFVILTPPPPQDIEQPGLAATPQTQHQVEGRLLLDVVV